MIKTYIPKINRLFNVYYDRHKTRLMFSSPRFKKVPELCKRRTLDRTEKSSEVYQRNYKFKYCLQKGRSAPGGYVDADWAGDVKGKKSTSDKIN